MHEKALQYGGCTRDFRRVKRLCCRVIELVIQFVPALAHELKCLVLTQNTLDRNTLRVIDFLEEREKKLPPTER